MADTQALPRTVGFWGTALFPVNGMIGAGIFALPAIMVAAVGIVLMEEVRFPPIADVQVQRSVTSPECPQWVESGH